MKNYFSSFARIEGLLENHGAQLAGCHSAIGRVLEELKKLKIIERGNRALLLRLLPSPSPSPAGRAASQEASSQRPGHRASLFEML